MRKFIVALGLYGVLAILAIRQLTLADPNAVPDAVQSSQAGWVVGGMLALGGLLVWLIARERMDHPVSETDRTKSAHVAAFAAIAIAVGGSVLPIPYLDLVLVLPLTLFSAHYVLGALIGPEDSILVSDRWFLRISIGVALGAFALAGYLFQHAQGWTAVLGLWPILVVLFFAYHMVPKQELHLPPSRTYD